MKPPCVRFTATTQRRCPARWWVHLTFFLAALVATQIILPAAVYDSEVHRCGTSECGAVTLLWLIGTAYVIALFLTRSERATATSKTSSLGQGTRRQLVTLVFSPWCFTNGHAVEVMTEHFTDTERLDRIDWAVIRAQYLVEHRRRH